MPSGAAVTSRKSIAPEGVKKSVFRPDIQGLRMIAVGAVILDHLIGWPSGGFVGVDVFFVISGFLITGLLLREHERTGTISFVGFYRRRVKRIIPVAMSVIILTVVAAWFLFNQPRFWSTFWDGFYATFFTANWRFAAVGTDYFQAEAGVSPLQHYWSLAVEEQFYFVWPWLMLLIFAITAKLTSWTHRTARTIAGIVMLAITLASFVWSLNETVTAPTWAYFSTLSRTWELGIGALIAVFSAVFLRLPAFSRPVLAWIGLAGIAVSLFVVNAESAFPAPWAALPVLSTALVIIAGTGGDQRFLWPITNRGSRYVGDISYSLYVWHWPIIVFGTLLWGEEPLVLLALLAAIVLVSVYSYHFFEDPIRRSAWLEPKVKAKSKSRGRRPRSGGGPSVKTQVGAIILVLAVTGGVSAAALFRPVPNVAAAQVRDTDSMFSDTTEETAAPTLTPELAALGTQIDASLAATTYPADLSPTMDQAISGAQAPEDVSACGQLSKLVDKEACTWGSTSPTYRAAILGDSVSLTWVNPLRNAMPADWSLTSLGSFGCRFTDFNEAEASSSECVARKADAVSYVNETHPNLLIVAHSYWLGALEGEEEPPTMPEWKANLSSALSKMDLSQTRVVFLGAPPSPANPNNCYTPLSGPADCAGKVPAQWKAQGSAESDMAAGYGGMWADTSDLFCTTSGCPIFVDKTPVRRDLTHMTVTYGEKIIPALREILDGSGFWAPKTP